jgi:hypothetical protein
LGTACIWTGGNESKRQLEEHAMKFLFEDDTFSFETLRTTGFANSFGADLGEVLATARQNTDGDQAIPVLTLLMSVSPHLAWAVRNGMWVLHPDHGRIDLP